MKRRMAYAVAVALATVYTAQALTIEAPNPSSDLASGDPPPILAGSSTSVPGIFAEIAAEGITLGSELYKNDLDDGDSGPFASSYNTVYDNEPGDPADFTISYDGGPTISGSPLYLLVKDGNANPAWYLYDITSWNGTDDIVGTGFWVNPEQGAISHVAIYGPGNGVPDGGLTILLLGAAMSALGFANRKLRKA